MASRSAILKREQAKILAQAQSIADEIARVEAEEKDAEELQSVYAEIKKLTDRAARIKARTALIPEQKQATPRKIPLGPTTKPVLSHTSKKKTLGPRYQPPQQQSRIAPRYVDRTKLQYGPVERPIGHKTPIRQQYGPIERPQTSVRQYEPSPRQYGPQRPVVREQYGPVERPFGYRTPIRQQYGPLTRPVRPAIPQPGYIPVPPVFKPRKKFVVVKRPPPLPPKRKRKKRKNRKKKKRGPGQYRERVVPDEEESKDLDIIYEEKEREVKVEENPPMGTYTLSQVDKFNNKLRDYTRVKDLEVSGLSAARTDDEWFDAAVGYFNKSWNYKLFPQEFIDNFRRILQARISTGRRYAIMYRFMGINNWRSASRDGELLLNMLNHSDLNAAYRHLEEFGSDLYDQSYIMSFQDVRLEEVIPKRKMEGAAGGFFPKKMRANMHGIIDLQRYQIYDNSVLQKMVSNADNEACLFYALEKSGVSTEDLNSVNDIAFGTSRKFIPTKDIASVADILGITIQIHYYRASDRAQKEVKTYGSGEVVHKLCMYLAHIFVFEDTEFKDWAFLSVENFALARKNPLLFSRGKTMSSLRLISRMDNINLFPIIVEDRVGSVTAEEKINIPLNRIGEDQVHDKYGDGIFFPADKFDPVQFDIPEDFRKMAVRRRIRQQVKDIVQSTYGNIVVYADTETYKNEEGVHTINRLGYCTHSNDRVKILRPDSNFNFIKRFVTNLLEMYPILPIEKELRDGVKIYPQPIIVYFHNMKYDLHAMLQDGIRLTSILANNGIVYGASIKTKLREIQFRDSFKMINAGLGDFGTMFNLDIKKQELVAYDWYTPARDNCVKVSTEEYLSYMGKCEVKDCSFDNVTPLKRQEQLLHCLLSDNADEFEYDGTSFNPWKYYEHYLRYDCKVLRAGMLAFRERVKDLLHLDVLDSMTISTLAQKNIRARGGYASSFQVRGHLRRYISEAGIGGRVWANPKYVQKVIPEVVQALDARSLYSAAIVRLREQYGVPTRKFKRLCNFNREHVLSLPYFIVDIIITKVGRSRSIPIICSKDDNGILDYTNNVPNKSVRIDKITLEDYIKYHEIEFDIISGVYIPEGTIFNNLICDSTQDLYNIRDEAKDKPTKKIIKSILVSEYGKNLTKLHETELVIVRKHKYDDDGNKDVNAYIKQYFYRNSHIIKKITEINDDQGLVELESNDRSFSYAHLGVMILSMSKRIMNEVFDCMEYLGKPLYYMDTDSCHVSNADIPEIVAEFRERYGRELIGDGLGQFHSDFELPYTDENGKTCEAKDVVSVDSLYFGKKVYCEKLEGYRINPKTEEKEIVTGYHYRMKGISSQGVKAKSDNEFGGVISDLYKHICHNRIQIDSVVDGGRPRFKYDNFFSVYTAKTDIRSIGIENGVVTEPEPLCNM